MSATAVLDPHQALARFYLGRVYSAKSKCRKRSLNGMPRVAQEGNSGLLLMLLLFGTFDIHRRDWRALLRRMRLLRLGLKRQNEVTENQKSCGKTSNIIPPSPSVSIDSNVR